LFGIFKATGPVLQGKSVELRLPAARDFSEWKLLRENSRAELVPFEPNWATHELSRAAFRARAKQARTLAAANEGFQFFIFETSNSALVGGITLGNIRRGAAQTGEIGYWLGTEFRGQGFMREAVSTIQKFAFVNLRLHRIEAACIQTNTKSIALLQHSGFHYEGSARAYLEINGRRQDHHLYACLPNDISGDI
jgi:[ribosomal protein S5]-alanine N-acetyltransferase